jgi:uracil-DNA glycosylase
MDTAPRSDQPRANRDPAEVERKLSLLHASHVAPLTEFVEQLRNSHFGALVPYFDPTEAGVGATMLCLFEAPGPKAAPPNGSGFVSCDNNDQTAQNMWTLLNEAGVDRASEYVAWNVVPWYVGDGKKLRAVRADDLRDARAATEELLALLPRVRTVVLFGKAAARAWKSVGTMEAIEAPHPSPLNVNTRPAAKKEIRDALIEARARSRT